MSLREVIPTPAELIRETEDRFQVNSSVYSDSEVFEQEIKLIFEKGWVYLCHESELEHPGDYLTTAIGRVPIVVTKDDSGNVNALINRCAHRGAVVCRQAAGNATTFRCPYHGWVYANDGRLLGAAQRTGYGDDFKQWGLRMQPVGAVESYRGLIFACLFDPPVSLSERLSNVKKYIDLWCDRSPEGMPVVAGPVQRYEYPGNWKLQVENGVDGYHGNYVHESFIKILDQSAEASSKSFIRERNRTDSRNYTKSMDYGDGLIEREAAMVGTYPYRNDTNYIHTLSDRYGPTRAEEILINRNILIFPNLFLFESHIRVIRPIEVDSTIVDLYPTVLRGATATLNNARLREHQRFFGVSSFGQPDDIEMFASVQAGIQGYSGWSDFSRGMHREVLNEAGERVGHSTDETPQRGIYRYWRACMGELKSICATESDSY